MILPGRALDLGFAAFVAAQLGAAAWLVPSGDQIALPGGGSLGGLCWFRGVFHIDCPFCGMTRSFVALAHGDVASALRFHPAGPIGPWSTTRAARRGRAPGCGSHTRSHSHTRQ